MDLDDDRCARICEAGDPRYDGVFFLGVTSTGIYCRPSCPARTPRRTNMTFHRSAAAAVAAGYRACKRCRPDASPGSPEWNLRADVVGRAMRLIADGAVDRDGVAGLARRLGYSERQLHRLVVAELGASPLAVARSARAQTARILLETTALPVADVAFASGFSSVRQFNDTIRDVYAVTPSDLRRRGAGPDAGAPAAITVRLAARGPADLRAELGFLAARAIPGVEHVGPAEQRGGAGGTDVTSITRTLRLPRATGRVRIDVLEGTGGELGVRGAFELDDVADLGPAVDRVRRWLALDDDTVPAAEVLGADPVLAPLVARRPGLRLPGTVDPWELAVRAVVGQQVSVAGARTTLGRLAASLGSTLGDGGADRADRSGREPRIVFPSAEQVAAADPDRLGMPRSRGRALVGLAEAVATGAVELHIGADRDATRAALREVWGIGGWTADYVVMRGLGDPDVLLADDLGVRRAAAALGLPTSASALAVRAETWAPWRSAATAHLWASLAPDTGVER